MVEPLAATRSRDRAKERSEDEAGYTLSSAPESIKKWRPEFLSKMDIVDGRREEEGDEDEPTVATDGRLDRFPAGAGSDSSWRTAWTCS